MVVSGSNNFLGGNRRNNHRSRVFDKLRGSGANCNPRVSNSQLGTSFHTIIESNLSSSNENTMINNENQIIWLLGNGCTDHIIDSDEHFKIQVTLKNTIKVKVGIGRRLDATKVDNIIIYFPVYDNESIVTI